MVRIEAKTNEMLGLIVFNLVDGSWRYIVDPKDNSIFVYEATSSAVKRFFTKCHLSYKNVFIDDLEQ